MTQREAEVADKALLEREAIFDTKASFGCSYASDFSVSTRLVSGGTYNHAKAVQNGCRSEHGPTQPAPGWQFILPSDQGITRHRGQAGLYEPAANVALSVAHSQFLSPASPCYPGASTHHHALPFAEDWSSQAVTVADSHPSSSIGANRIPSEWNSACGKAESSSSEDDTGGDLNEEETETDSAVESNNQSTNDNERDSDPKKPKRTRTAYSNYQLDQLELVFSNNHYPDFFTREELARTLGIREDRIQIWFQNKRARCRKLERTGSVSFRSRYRQRHLQELQECQAAMQLYNGSSYHSSPSFMFQSTSSHVPGTPTGISNFMSSSPISAAVSHDAVSTPPPYPMSTIDVTAPADNK